jgi:hypothetical protein
MRATKNPSAAAARRQTRSPRSVPGSSRHDSGDFAGGRRYPSVPPSLIGWRLPAGVHPLTRSNLARLTPGSSQSFRCPGGPLRR